MIERIADLRERRRQSGAARALSQHDVPDRDRRRRAISSRSSRAASSRSRPARSSRRTTASRCARRATNGRCSGRKCPSPATTTSSRCSSAASSPSKATCIRSWRTCSTSRTCWPRRASRAKEAAAMSPRFEPIIGRYLNLDAARPAAPALCRGGRPGHSAALPAHRRLRRAAVSRPAQRRAHHRELPRHRVRHAVARQIVAARGLSERGIQAHLARLHPDDPGNRRRAGARQAGGDGLLDRRAHRALSRAPARQALPRHHRAGKRRRMSRPITTSSGCTGRDVHGGEVSAGVVSGLVAPTAPDNHRWETLWHYLQSGPGVFKGDLHFYKVDGDIRGKIDEIDGKRGEPLSAHRRIRLFLHHRRHARHRQAHRRAGDHHEGPRPFPDERGPAEVHRLSAAGAGEDSRRGVSSRQSENAMSHAEAVHTLQPAAGATDADRAASPARCATTRCRRTRATTRGGICSTPSA